MGEYLRRAAEAGLSWPLPEGLKESELEQRLFPPPPELSAQDPVGLMLPATTVYWQPWLHELFDTAAQKQQENLDEKLYFD